MWKRGLSILLVLALAGIVFASVAWAGGGEGNDDPIADQLTQLQKQVNDLEELVKGIAFDAQKLDSLENIVKEISFEMKSDQGKIRDLEVFRQSIDQDLRPRVVKLESSVSGLNFTVQKQGEKLTKLDGLSEAVAELQPRVFSLETTVQGLAAKLKTDEEQLKQLSLLEVRVKQLEKKATDLEAGLRQCQAQMGAGPGDMSQLKDLKNRLAMLESTVSGLMSKIQANASQLADQSGRLAALEATTSEISTLKDEVAKLKSSARTMTLVAVGGLLIGIAALALHFISL